MRKAFKIILPIVLALVVLVAAYWFFFRYRSDLPAEYFLSKGTQKLEQGHYNAAVTYLEQAYKLCSTDADIALKMSQAYQAAGNYTKTEYVLVNAIASTPDRIDLYVALSQAYVAQDKLLDAQQMLDQVINDSVRAQLDEMRPAAPTVTPESGYYSEYISVEAAADDGTCYLSCDGQFPSISKNAYTEPLQLQGGETTVCAISVNEDGLVSPAVYIGYTVAGVVEDVTFVDKNLESYVQELLNKGTRTLQTDDLWGITELVLPENLTDLSDLVWFTGLTSLTIHEVANSDFAFLSSMPSLRKLDLTGCGVTSESMQLIGSLSLLEELHLSDCGLSNLKALSTLKSLRLLDLSDNSINDISPLAGLKALEELNLSQNALTDLSNLRALTSLKKLDVSFNALTDVSALSKCKAIETLSLAHNNLTEIKAVGDLVNLLVFDASNNQITEITSMSACKKLQELVMEENLLTSLDALNNIDSITKIDIDYNDVKQTPVFSAESKLVSFSAAHNFLETLEGLSGLPMLNYVNTDYNNITDISCLASCPNLVQVNVFGTNIKEVKSLTDHGVIVNWNPVY